MAARRGNHEEGSLLIVIMIGVAISAIALGIVTQAWTTTWRRDKEEELVFRAQQYVKGILAYRKEHGGQFPLNLEDLYKPGPRRLRYIRRLYRDPLAKDGRWGLLYLMPGGQGVYDPVAAQRAQQAKTSGWGEGPADSGQLGTAPGGMPQPPGSFPAPPGAPGGGFPGGAPGFPGGAFPMKAPSDSALDDEERVSEPPIGWPIVGVVSRSGPGRFAEEKRASAVPNNFAEKTFKIYKGHDDVTDWQFHVFDMGAEIPQAPGTQGPAPFTGKVGPGFGGEGGYGLGGPRGPRQGGRTGPMLPGLGGVNKGAKGGSANTGGQQMQDER